ncbi:urea ABC transporter permease subunit UrtC [Leptolyngbya sp. FACHB-36]|uniref:urea ABC transporter permease subunit UrtC n=1 Tax=Leptolyngbya sp. FACHB-36 TaxID=2692808 RepID=UPI0016803ADD|nr:urea ABC transporter permease subunit UrtC [Leptolyngbya sp. FACHB-36]MBD2019881.1 urea ABC transporter permease subunit UrtC [Leptolyngbya sp. FACHB-36]
MAIRIKRVILSPYTLFILIVLVLPPLLVADPFWLNRLSLYLVFGILALSMCLCWGYCGILSLGHGAFFGIGAYCMAMSLKLLSPDSLAQGTPFPLPDFMVWNTPPGQALKLPLLWVPFQNQWFGLFAALLVPTLFAAIVGWFVFNGGVSGVFISIITLSIVVILNLLLIDQQPLTNGFNGLTNLAVFQIGDWAFDPYSLSTYFLIAGSLVAVLLGLKWLTSTKTGLLLKAIRADEQRVRYFGYDIASYKIFILSISAMVAGFAGALFVVNSQYASPTIMDVGISIAVVVWTAVGGRESLIGAAIGAILINLVQSLLSENENLIQVWQLIVGILFVLVVMFLPEGLAGLVPRVLTVWRKTRNQSISVSSSDGISLPVATGAIKDE